MQIKTVRDLMITHYASITPEQTIATAATILIDYHLSALPVINEKKKLVGILSEADCLRSSLVGGYHNENIALVRDLMTPDPDTISPDSELSAATEIFLQQRRRLLPVVEAGNLVGLVTRKEFLQAIIEPS